MTLHLEIDVRGRENGRARRSCIIHDRKSEKHAQILRVDAIYSSSIITIATTSGPNAESGLAGISTIRRVPQKTEVADELRFALPLPDYMSLEKDNILIWNTSGWTFQEKIVSKRLLLFAPHQVYFQCSNMVWCEDSAGNRPDARELQEEMAPFAMGRRPFDGQRSRLQ